MTEVLLIGAPNAGKTTFFNELTGSHQRTGNWHGVTVAAAEKRVGEFLVIDLPGLYSLSALSMEERIARQTLAEHPNAVVLQVVEVQSLKRGLSFTEELVKQGISPVLILTKCDRFERRGGIVEPSILSKELGLTVLKKENFCLQDLDSYRPHKKEVKFTFSRGYTQERQEGTLWEGWLCRPWVAVAVFFVSLLLTFFFCFFPYAPCSLLKTGMQRLLQAMIQKVSDQIAAPFLRGFVCDCLLSGIGNVLSFLPQILGLYFCLSLLEESGLLSYVAFALDDLFQKVGLNGRAVFSLAMGFGCTTTAVTVTKGLPHKSIQRRTVFAMQFVPCSARLPVLMILLSGVGSRPFINVLSLYALCVLFTCATAYLFRPEREEDCLWELAPLQIPSLTKLLKGLLFPMKQFIIKTGTVMFSFLVGIWLFSSVNPSFLPCEYEDSILALLCKKIQWLFAPVGVNDWKLTLAFLSGLAAKENMAGILSLFYPSSLPFTERQLLSLLVFVMLCPPCVSCFAATCREVGKRAALLFFTAQTAVSLLCCYLTYAFGVGGSLLLLAVFLSLTVFIRKNLYERISRNRKHNAEKLHG